MNHDKFGVYVIRDNGCGDSSMPFFAYNNAVAVRQFTNSLRTLPPSVRPDFELLAIGTYDQSNLELSDSLSAVSIAVGSDDAIQKLIEVDKPFYERVSVDQLPVDEGGIKNEK